MDDYMASILDLTVWRTFQLAGFRKFRDRAATNVLNEILQCYISVLARQTAEEAIHNGRTGVNARDLFNVLAEMPTHGRGDIRAFKEWIEGDESLVIRKAVARANAPNTSSSSSYGKSELEMASAAHAAVHEGLSSEMEPRQRIQWGNVQTLDASPQDEDLMSNGDAEEAKLEFADHMSISSPASSNLGAMADGNEMESKEGLSGPVYLPPLPDIMTDATETREMEAMAEIKSEVSEKPTEAPTLGLQVPSIQDFDPASLKKPSSSTPFLMAALSELQNKGNQEPAYLPPNPLRRKIAFAYNPPESISDQGLPRPAIYDIGLTDVVQTLARRTAHPFLLAKVTQSEPVTTSYDSKKKFDQPLSAIVTTPGAQSNAFPDAGAGRPRSESLSYFQWPGASHQGSPSSTPAKSPRDRSESIDLTSKSGGETQRPNLSRAESESRTRIRLRLGSVPSPASPGTIEPGTIATGRPLIRRIRIVTKPMAEMDVSNLWSGPGSPQASRGTSVGKRAMTRSQSPAKLSSGSRSPLVSRVKLESTEGRIPDSYFPEQPSRPPEPTPTKVGQSLPAADVNQDESIHCICSNPHLDDGAYMIACERCDKWFHGACVHVSPNDLESGKVTEWECPRCTT